MGAGGNRKRPCVLHCSLLLDVQQVFVNLAQNKIWEAYNRGDHVEIEGRPRELPYLLLYQGHIRELMT